jgi:bacteriorhodopsin
MHLKNTISEIHRTVTGPYIINTNQRCYDKFLDLMMVLWVGYTFVHLLADSMRVPDI